MPEKDSEAVVLRSFPLGEADRLVSFLSRTYGRMRGVARGARRPKSRFGATLEPLSHVHLWFYERETRDLVRITQSELLESFLEAQSDYACSVGFALMAEVAEAVLPEHEPSDPAFRLLVAVSQSIDRTRRTALPLLYFNLWTVRLGGWLPALDRCARCGASLEAVGGFAARNQQGLFCPLCKRSGMRSIPRQGLAAARRILQQKLEAMEKDWVEAQGAELNEFLLDVIEHQIERPLTTRRMAESLP